METPAKLDLDAIFDSGFAVIASPLFASYITISPKRLLGKLAVVFTGT